jgi:hypothetical protein
VARGWRSGFRVRGSGFGVWVSGFGVRVVWGSGSAFTFDDFGDDFGVWRTPKKCKERERREQFVCIF